MRRYSGAKGGRGGKDRVDSKGVKLAKHRRAEEWIDGTKEVRKISEGERRTEGQDNTDKDGKEEEKDGEEESQSPLSLVRLFFWTPNLYEQMHGVHTLRSFMTAHRA